MHIGTAVEPGTQTCRIRSLTVSQSEVPMTDMVESITLNVREEVHTSQKSQISEAQHGLLLDPIHEQDLPAIDTSFEAWLFLLGALLLEFIVWGYGYAFGILQEYYSSESSPFYGGSTVAISSIGTVGVGLQYMLGLFFEPLYKAYPQAIKISMWLSLLVAAGCFFISSWATKIWHLIILQGVIFGISSAALYFPVIVWLSEWFFHRRSFAAGIIFGGSSAGGVLFPFVFRYLLDGLGYANAMRVWSAFFFIAGALAINMVKPRIKITSSNRALYPKTLRFPDFSFLRTRAFVMFATTVLAQRLAYTPMTVLIASYTKEFDNVTNIQSTLALVILNFSGIIGLVVQGYFGDRIQYWKITLASGLASALIAGLLLGFAQNLAMIYAFAVCYGVASGGYAATWTAAAKSLKEENSGTIFLSFSFVGGIATVAGPLIAASLQSTSKVVSKYGSHGFRDVVIFITTNLAFMTIMGILTGLDQNTKTFKSLIHSL